MELEFDAEGRAAIGSPRAALRQVQLLDFGLHQRGDNSRSAVEDYIRNRFAAVHGARITHFLPHLVSVGHGDTHCAAVGLAMAARSRLFAETYLDAPVERMIERQLGEPVARADILEIGNLVSTWKGSSLLLFVFLSELIAHLGQRFVLFTATPEVERLLARLGYAPQVLAEADPAQLPDGGVQWGRYYERRPRVMFGEVAPAVAAARRDLLYRGVAHSIASQVDRMTQQLSRR
ncbi:MAG: thermostable hemolysin [Chiayiivirga sp.]|jgi:hypothetical protein|uniref:thermostable hemolysin n=1 Tax=Chiayiivirga sp. TaxID=2041042 RepID=UPI0025C0F263|nr:thermostable hemolysin [Chiayiivirga sp.]MCI1710882.1 thermostable hemolysin [Chiayiivirga sp.]MCI1728326.1 thermostable hemolysin [Chiayiivirga sp.]